MVSRIFFRVDASSQIGSGHIMRCLTLADTLHNQGIECHFICREHQGHMLNLITERAHIVHNLPVVKHILTQEPGSLSHSAWLGSSQQEDAQQCQQILKLFQPDWLIVDHYSLDSVWETLLRPYCNKLMVIDDLVDRQHDCDILLDQNVLNIDIKNQYQTKINKDCMLLLGPNYAILQPEYCSLANVLPDRDGYISRVLVFVGGCDPHHLTEHYLTALNNIEYSHLFVDVVIGQNHPTPSKVQKLVNERSKSRFYIGLPSLSALMVRADLMLGAGGSTNWERMCLGLNAIVASIAMNQKNINCILHSKELIAYLGEADKLNLNTTREAINFSLNNPYHNQQQSKNMRHTVDGCGTKRIIQHLMDGTFHVSA